MQSINITNAQHMLSMLNGGVQFERVLHYLRLLGTVLPSIQNFGCGLALSFTQAACKQARSLRHFSGRVRKMQEQQKQVQQVIILFDITNYPPRRKALTQLFSGYSAAASFGCY
jgi:hypothetical protein